MDSGGDRYFRDDPAIVGGIAYLDGQPVTVIGAISPREQKQLVLLLIEEVVGVSCLKEDIAGNGPKKNAEVR